MALSVLLRWGADTQQTTRSGISALQLADQHVRKPRLRSLLLGETALYPKLQLGDSDDDEEEGEEEEEEEQEAALRRVESGRHA